jgi:very-short-patch-repair endonuclease
MKNDNASRLRLNQTEVEKRIWFRLRDRRLFGIKFRRQAPVGPYIVDFLCREYSLIIELDGGQHAAAVGRDDRRTDWLQAHGWRVIRFWNNEVIENIDGVLLKIAGECGVDVDNPHPVPLPQAGEGDC